MIRRYPHQLFLRPPAQAFIGLLRFESYLSYVLNAQGTNTSSAALFTAGSRKMAPAARHPCHPGHSAKLAKIGLPVLRASSIVTW